MKYVNKLVVVPVEEWERMKTDEEEDKNKIISHNQTIISDSSVPLLNDSNESQFRRIIEPIPNEGKEHAGALLTLLSKRSFWNNGGEIISDGQIIPGSSIVQLITHAVTNDPTFTPVGILQFYQLLKERDIPVELITSEKGRDLMSRDPYIPSPSDEIIDPLPSTHKKS